MLTNLRNSLASLVHHARALVSGSDQTDHTQSNLLQAKTSQRGVGLDVYGGDDEKFNEYAITRYPPFDKGIPVLPVSKILHSQQDLIERIYRTAGVSKKDFERLYLPPIRNLANQVHLLPATSKTYFRGTGGLFRFSLELALNTLQVANAAVFPVGGGVERRYFMMPRWALASFIAGLCSQNYRTVNTMAVMTKDNGQWSPLISPLSQWAEDQGVDVYFVRWMEEGQVRGAQAAAAYSISQIVPQEVLYFLAEENHQIIPSMTAAIAGVETEISENPIGRLIGPVVTRVIADDLARSATNYGHLVIGTHLEMHLVDAMRSLVRSGKWIANSITSGGRVWVGKEGVFIDWQKGAADIINQLAKNSFAGVPKEPETLAELLVSASLLEKKAGGEYYWSITLPGTFEAREGMVKLKNGKVIFPQGFDFDPFQNVELILNLSETTAKGQVSNHSKSADAGAASGGQEQEHGATTTDEASRQATETPPGKGKPSDTGASPGKPIQPNIGATPSGDSTSVESAQPDADATASSGKQADSGAVSSGGEPAQTQSRSTARGSKTADADANGPEPKKAAAPKNAPKPGHPAAEGAETSSEPAPPSQGIATKQVTTKLLGSLKDSNAWLLSEVRKAYEKGAAEGTLAELPYGFGISQTELNRHGIPIMELLEELAAKAWLWQDKSKITRRIHPVEIDGNIERMVILKKDIAAGLGFKVEGS